MDDVRTRSRSCCCDVDLINCHDMLCRYRFQLEAFVDQVRGRKPRTWVSAQDSIDNMKTVEMIYAKVGATCRVL